jgi:hypothetical protein
MTTITPEWPEVEVKPGFQGFVGLAEAVGLDLEPFQRRIVKAALGPERELLVLIGRGNGKSCLQALVALHHLTTVEDAEIFICASSRDQARIMFQYATKFARELDHPNVIHRHLELRYCPDPDEPKVYTRFLRCLPAEAPRLFGLTPPADLATDCTDVRGVEGSCERPAPTAPRLRGAPLSPVSSEASKGVALHRQW